MQRFVLPAVVVLLGACAARSAPTPVIPDAPTLADADPLEYRTAVAREDLATPLPLAAELVGPWATATLPAAAAMRAGPAPAPAPETGLASLMGDYRYSGGKASAAKSIETVVGKMSALVRSIARKRLTAANRVPKTLSIAQVGSDVTVRIDGRAYTAKLGGAAKRVKDANGEASRMRLQLRGDALYQILDASQGDRTNVFTRRKDGGVTMSVRISSKQLPADVRYQVSFRPAG
jgi:hypothetical protein